MQTHCAAHAHRSQASPRSCSHHLFFYTHTLGALRDLRFVLVHHFSVSSLPKSAALRRSSSVRAPFRIARSCASNNFSRWTILSISARFFVSSAGVLTQFPNRHSREIRSARRASIVEPEPSKAITSTPFAIHAFTEFVSNSCCHENRAYTSATGVCSSPTNWLSLAVCHAASGGTVINGNCFPVSGSRNDFRGYGSFNFPLLGAHPSTSSQIQAATPAAQRTSAGRPAPPDHPSPLPGAGSPSNWCRCSRWCSFSTRPG